MSTVLVTGAQLPSIPLGSCANLGREAIGDARIVGRVKPLFKVMYRDGEGGDRGSPRMVILLGEYVGWAMRWSACDQPSTQPDMALPTMPALPRRTSRRFRADPSRTTRPHRCEPW